MHTSERPGLFHQLRIARRNPGAALMAAPIGAAIPLALYALSHLGHLITWQDGEITFAGPENPYWYLWGLGLYASSPTVFRVGVDLFRRHWPVSHAIGLVALTEGIVAVQLHPWVDLAALAVLVLINATGAACQAALQDAADRATDIEVIAVPAPRPKPARAALPAQATRAALQAMVDEPPLATTSPDAEYAGVLDYIARAGQCSGAALKRDLRMGTDKIARTVARLEADGVVGAPVPGGPRPLIMSAVQLGDLRRRALMPSMESEPESQVTRLPSRRGVA